MLKLRMPHDVAALVRSLHPHLQKKVRAAFEILMREPQAGKTLKEELSGLRSFRVGRYRVIYRVPGGKELDIVAVGPRERIYEDTYLLIRKAKK
ncbi:MAG TPA: type II toxin-antitoxin system RelE/ParE family toxin [Nitrospirota bacterium]